MIPYIFIVVLALALRLLRLWIIINLMKKISKSNYQEIHFQPRNSYNRIGIVDDSLEVSEISNFEGLLSINFKDILINKD